jgi:hypothetical protein
LIHTGDRARVSSFEAGSFGPGNRVGVDSTAEGEKDVAGT